MTRHLESAVVSIAQLSAEPIRCVSKACSSLIFSEECAMRLCNAMCFFIRVNFSEHKIRPMVSFECIESNIDP